MALRTRLAVVSVKKTLLQEERLSFSLAKRATRSTANDRFLHAAERHRQRLTGLASSLCRPCQTLTMLISPCLARSRRPTARTTRAVRRGQAQRLLSPLTSTVLTDATTDSVETRQHRVQRTSEVSIERDRCVLRRHVDVKLRRIRLQIERRCHTNGIIVSTVRLDTKLSSTIEASANTRVLVLPSEPLFLVHVPNDTKPTFSVQQLSYFRKLIYGTCLDFLIMKIKE